MYRSPSRSRAWTRPNANPSRLVYWWRSKGWNTAGQTRAILLVMISPLAIENQSKAKATNALARDRYQKTFGSAPTRDAPTMGTQIGIVSRAREAPTIVAATKDHNGMLDREDVLGARLCLV